MSRVKLLFPQKIHYSCTVPILVQHINYGNHVGNDSIVSILHHARVQFLTHLGYNELNVEGIGIIMADLQVQYKKQLFLHSTITIHLSVDNFSTNSFSINYKIVDTNDNENVAILAKTNMVCFDYALQKISAVPNIFIEKINSI